MNKKLLWTENLEECRLAGDEPPMYFQFCYYIQLDGQKRRAMHINRKAFFFGAAKILWWIESLFDFLRWHCFQIFQGNPEVMKAVHNECYGTVSYVVPLLGSAVSNTALA
ncbi:hypothetical protein ACQRBN_04560 [Bariatricus sp. SGI.154]